MVTDNAKFGNFISGVRVVYERTKITQLGTTDTQKATKHFFYY